MTDVLRELNLEDILKKAGKPLDPVEAFEFAQGLIHNSLRRSFPGRTELVDSFWAGKKHGTMVLTEDRKMALGSPPASR